MTVSRGRKFREFNPISLDFGIKSSSRSPAIFIRKFIKTVLVNRFSVKDTRARSDKVTRLSIYEQENKYDRSSKKS